jgi:hypothetical protein
MNRRAARSAAELFLFFIAFGIAPQRSTAHPRVGGSLPAAKACSLVTKAEAESIVGASLVVHRSTDDECWYVESGFTKPAAPHDKQVYLNIWHYDTPQPDDVSTTRANIADRQPTAVTTDLPGFADAALWSWMPGAGRLSAFKGGTIGVDVMIGGIAEASALQHAKALAVRALGSAGRTGFAYGGAAGAQAAQVHVVTARPESPAAYRNAWMGQTRTVRGTVSRVDVKPDGYPKWLTVYFRESPEGAFVVCSPYPDMFMETVGDLYRLVGKTLLVTGIVESSMCAGKGGSIKVVESGGYRVEGLSNTTLTMAAGSVPRRAQGPRLGLDICNAGKPAIDAVIAKQGRATLFHVPPAQCAHVYEDTAGAASVGFAFADAQGKWGPATRVDWRQPSSEIWSQGGGETLSVRRGNATVALPAQMLFHPPHAICRTDVNYRTEYDPAHPYDARYARQVPAGTTTVCDNTEYDLNVVAYPETREVAFEKKCYACPPTSTPAEQAQSRQEVQQTTAAMSQISPLAGGLMAGVVAGMAGRGMKESAEGPPEYRLMSWDELRRIPSRPPGGGRPPQMPQYFAMRGTVSRVEMRPAPSGSNERGPWVNVYFRESTEQTTGAFGTSYGAWSVCTFGTEILERMFGPDFRTRMVGQVLEVEGEYSHSCMAGKGSIRIELAHQIRKVGRQ